MLKHHPHQSNRNRIEPQPKDPEHDCPESFGPVARCVLHSSVAPPPSPASSSQLHPNSKARMKPKKNKTEKSKREHTIFRTDSHRAPLRPRNPSAKKLPKGEEEERDPEVSDAECRRVNWGVLNPHLRRARLSRAGKVCTFLFRPPRVTISGT